MSPQRRTALVSVFAALALIALKLSVGLVTDSLGLLSDCLLYTSPSPRDS